jgi:hypothetical protein
MSPLEASNKALEVLRETTELVEKHIRSLQLLQEQEGAGRGSATITTPEIMKRFKAVTSAAANSSSAVGASGRRGGNRGADYGSVDRSKVIEMPLADNS